MKLHEIREKTLEEVKDDLLAAQENLRNLKFQMVTHQLDKTSMINQVKKDIARMNTVIREHELKIHPLVVPNTVAESEGK